MNQFTKFKEMAVAVAVSVSAVLYANSVSYAADPLRVVMHSSVKVLDPHVNNAFITRDHGYMIYDTLFALDENLQPQPQMVDSYSLSDDKMTWTFKLRQGLTFHDGAPVTSADVIASIKRWGGVDGLGGMLLESSASMDAVDDLTFKIVLNKPFGLVLDALGKQGGLMPFILPKRLAEIAPTQGITEAIGSGPFKFIQDEWQPGVITVYEKFTDYKPRPEASSSLAGGKVVKVDRVEWITMTDPQTIMSALLRGGEK